MAATPNTRQYLPHALIIGIFIILSCIFCYPAFQGNKILPHDTYSWICISQESRDYYQQTGENAFWTNSLFSGMPVAMLDIHPETNWYHKLGALIQNYTDGEPTNPVFYFIIAMISFYALMLSLCVNKWVGAAGAIAFAFSSYMPIIAAAGHNTKLLDIALLPGLLAGILVTYRGKYVQGAALAGLFLALFLYAGHYQIIYYAMIVIVVMVIALLVNALRKGQLKRFLLASLTLAITAIIAALTSATPLITAYAYNTHSIRGGTSELHAKSEESGGLDKDYAFSWSNGIGETFCILVPNLYGGSTAENIGEDSHLGQTLSELGAQPYVIDQMTANANTYWGPQPFVSGPVYFGAVICFLFVLSLCAIRSKHKWWAAGVALFFILLSLGSHFKALNYFLFDHLPMYNKFRTPSMALSIPLLIFPAMGAWGLWELLNGHYDKDAIWKKVRTALVITGGLCVLILISVMMFMDFTGARDQAMQQQYGQAGEQIMRAIREDRSAMAMKDTFRSLVYIVLAALALWAYAKNKIKSQFAVLALGALITFDEVSVAKRYLNSDSFLDEITYEQQFAPRPVDQQIMKDTDPYYRVMDLSDGGNGPFNNPKPSLFHKMVGGYHPAKLEIYQDLIEHQLGNLNYPVLNMLNTKYFIVPGGRDGQPIVQPNPAALGNAWFVSEIQWAATADEEMQALNGPSIRNPMDTSQGNFQPAVTAVIRGKYKDQFGGFNIGKDSSAHIKLTKYSPRELEFTAQNSQDGFAVFSDIFYPEGWTATIDGKEVPIYCVDYVLRGLQVPAGQHTIKFSFVLPNFEKGENIALTGSILLTLIILTGLFFAYKKKKPAV